MRSFCVYSLLVVAVLVSARELYAQTLTAPPEHFRGDVPKKKVTTPTPSLPDPTPQSDPAIGVISPSLLRVEYARIEPNNPNNLTPGFYATFAPPVPDTIEVFEGGTDQAEVINVNGGKEILQGDSLGVLADVKVREGDFASGVVTPKKGKTNSIVIRSGFIPGQGFGTNRFRFSVKPGKFTLRRGAMISASVHMMSETNNIGNILCAVTGIDYEKNVFYVEASNEIPKGESINWVIVNYPETFTTR